MTTNEEVAQCLFVVGYALIDVFGREIASLKGEPYDFDDYKSRFVAAVNKYKDYEFKNPLP